MPDSFPLPDTRWASVWPCCVISALVAALAIEQKKFSAYVAGPELERLNATIVVARACNAIPANQ